MLGRCRTVACSYLDCGDEPAKILARAGLIPTSCAVYTCLLSGASSALGSDSFLPRIRSQCGQRWACRLHEHILSCQYPVRAVRPPAAVLISYPEVVRSLRRAQKDGNCRCHREHKPDTVVLVPGTFFPLPLSGDWKVASAPGARPVQKRLLTKVA